MLSEFWGPSDHPHPGFVLNWTYNPPLDHYHKYISNIPPYNYNENELDIELLYETPTNEYDIEFLFQPLPNVPLYYDTIWNLLIY